MNRYVLEFEKKDLMIYISHLDLLRLFKRAFKRAGININYSKGFNPHPIMGFAQPLSLGYTGLHEYVEFESQCSYGKEIIEKLNMELPEGIRILNIDTYRGKKTLAADTKACKYVIKIPISKYSSDINGYLEQNEIIALKRMKKTKKYEEVNIKDKIREFNYEYSDGYLTLRVLLDGGSISNLSPELIINSLLDFINMDVERNKISVLRENILFN
jgi:radical SAM-linked protein